jgi:hypothetical protein
VTNNSFNTGKIGYFVPTIINGTFDSTTEAHGTVQFIFTNAPIFQTGSTGGCPAQMTSNWTATKHR